MIAGKTIWTKILSVLTWVQTWQLHHFLESPYGVLYIRFWFSSFIVDSFMPFTQTWLQGTFQSQTLKTSPSGSLRGGFGGSWKTFSNRNPFEPGRILVFDSLPLTPIVLSFSSLLCIFIPSKSPHKRTCLMENRSHVWDEEKKLAGSCFFSPCHFSFSSLLLLVSPCLTFQAVFPLFFWHKCCIICRYPWRCSGEQSGVRLQKQRRVL